MKKKPKISTKNFKKMQKNRLFLLHKFSNLLLRMEESLVAKSVKNMLFNERHADMVFVVEEKRIPAHKVIVLDRCPYFR